MHESFTLSKNPFTLNLWHEMTPLASSHTPCAMWKDPSHVPKRVPLTPRVLCPTGVPGDGVELWVVHAASHSPHHLPQEPAAATDHWHPHEGQATWTGQSNSQNLSYPSC